MSASYRLDTNGCFVIEDYNRASPFCNFFPGVAGLWGIPMWAFYVNRGQGISSFGIEGKDKSILEFQPANKAWRLTSLQGFRTFLKIRDGKKTVEWEPFQDSCYRASFRTQQKMVISSHDMTIEDVNPALGLTVRVHYFTLPGEPVAALVRRLTVTNTSQKARTVEVVDGLPAVVPYGMKDWLVKNLSRTVEAWVQVGNLKRKAPYMYLKVEVSDTPEVQHIKEGNFYFAFDPSKSKDPLADMIVDPEILFGTSLDFTYPNGFFGGNTLKIPAQQQTSNRTPCAMARTTLRLGPKAEKQLVAMAGSAASEASLNAFVRRAVAKDFITNKAYENQDIVSGIKNLCLTNSSSSVFNHYAAQTFLDNCLRGGLPVSLKTQSGPVVFNVFSRKHGDPERDYNYFVLSPTYFSQGNGNYRDVNQNRRMDVFFNGDLQEGGLVHLMNLSQCDGYNPLVIKGMSFTAQDPMGLRKILTSSVQGKIEGIERYTEGEFQPGELITHLMRGEAKLKVSPQELLGRVLEVCRPVQEAEHGEGFWTDHWTYNMDLIESFLMLYPERLRELLLEKRAFSFYRNSHYVLPRDRRYYLTDKGVRQYRSVERDPEIASDGLGHQVRSQNGAGPVYITTLAVKCLCLIANKIATLDPSGIGVEMEADKPNWYDSLNGLPGLLGSSISETLETQRMAEFLLGTLGDASVPVFEELATFIEQLTEILSEETDPLSYWHKANDVKEFYRARVHSGVEGRERDLPSEVVRKFLHRVVERTDRAVQAATTKDGIVATYFYHEVTDYRELEGGHDGEPNVYPKKFRRHTLPLFLEGPVHAMRVERDEKRLRAMYQAVRKSKLFDKKLKMYRVNTDLSKESEDIGRTRIFPPGWLENGSIWLHMEYKYLLELIRGRLYKEFYETFFDVLVAFHPPERYGRSTLENSSFLVSSAHEDPDLHGRGFVARLSGSTAEFLHIWMLMNVGPKPFVVSDRGELSLELKPALAEKLFTTSQSELRRIGPGGKWQTVTLPKNTYAFTWLGSTLVVYHNPRRKDTYDGAVIRESVLFDGSGKETARVTGPVIPSPHAQAVRSGRVGRIDVHLD